MRSTAPPDSCRLCGSRRIDPLFVKDAIPYLRCGVCGHQFSLPQGNANLDNRWEDYEPAYISYLAESADDAITMGALAGWMMRYAGLPGKDVLDVGCGSGKLVRHLHDLGAAATGIEPAKPLYDRFLAHAGAGYFNGTLGEFRIAHPDRRFDVLIANDVIEHLDDPLGFLTDLRAHGRPGGTIFIITPDAGSLLARGLGRWWHYYNRYHLSYLSRRSLSHLCARCNLELLSVTALTRQKSLYYLLRYLADMVVGSGAVQVPRWLERVTLPVNLFDTLYAALRIPQDTPAPSRDLWAGPVPPQLVRARTGNQVEPGKQERETSQVPDAQRFVEQDHRHDRQQGEGQRGERIGPTQRDRGQQQDPEQGANPINDQGGNQLPAQERTQQHP
jgi:2-polyprenyl-3-methyl-5-hydroxy-6-metoxy-1,4-benzoquinol methylase